jgi:hypothetical protein
MQCKGKVKVAEQAEQILKNQQNDFAIFVAPLNF